MDRTWSWNLQGGRSHLCLSCLTERDETTREHEYVYESEAWVHANTHTARCRKGLVISLPSTMVMYRSSTPASSSSGGTYVIPAATQISRPQVREFRRTRRQWDLHPGIFTEAGSPFLPSGMVTTGGREGGKDLDRDKEGVEGKQMVPRSDPRTVAKGQQQRHFDVSDDLEDSSSSQHSGPEEQKKSFQYTATSWPSCRNDQFKS